MRRIYAATSPAGHAIRQEYPVPTRFVAHTARIATSTQSKPPKVARSAYIMACFAYRSKFRTSNVAIIFYGVLNPEKER